MTDSDCFVGELCDSVWFVRHRVWQFQQDLTGGCARNLRGCDTFEQAGFAVILIRESAVLRSELGEMLQRRLLQTRVYAESR